MYKSPYGAVHGAKEGTHPDPPYKGREKLTRSEAEFITRSYLHEAKRSYLHEVCYTKLPTRSEAELIHEVPYVFPTILCIPQDWHLHLRWGICHDTAYPTGNSGA